MEEIEKKVKDLLKDEKKVYIAIVAFALIFFLIVPFIRIVAHDSILINGEGYYHAKIADDIKTEKIGLDDLFRDEGLGKKDIVTILYQLSFAGLSFFIGNYWSFIFLPWLLGYFTIIIFYRLLKDLGIDAIVRHAALIFFIISPVSIYVYSISSVYSLTIFLIMSGFYFLAQKSKVLNYCSYLVFILISLSNSSAVLFTLFLLVSYSFYDKKKGWVRYTIVPIMIIFSAFFDNLDPLIVKPSLTIILSDLGALHGIGIFVSVLALIGSYIVWQKKKCVAPYILFFFTVIACFYVKDLIIFVNALFVLLSSYTFYSLFKMKWKLKQIRFFTILIIICGIMFSSVSYMDRISAGFPDNDVIESLDWLEEHSDKSDIVLTYKDYGYLIQTVAKRKTVLDPSVEDTILLNSIDTLFMSRNLEIAKEILEYNNITIIYITPEMKNGLVWNKDKQGLLFLFRNKETFDKVYDQNGIEIWKVID